MEIALRSADGSRRTVLYRKEATAGQDVVLTIDVGLQLEAESLMQEKYSQNKSTGAVIVNDPKSGRIKAMASYPTFDLNLYAAPAAAKGAADLIKNEELPLLNRATQGLYPPGSVYKTVSAIAGLETGTVRVDTAFPYEDKIVKVTDKRTAGGRKAAGGRI